MENKILLQKQCLAAFCAAVNIIGSFLALGLRLPVYLDSLGTVFISGLFGPVYGIMTGVISNVVNGIVFDPYSFYYIPVQIVTACMASLVIRGGFQKGKKLLPGALAVSLPASVTGALITAFVFGGITSSGSSYFVALLHTAGMNLTMACFLAQALTDYADRLLVLFLAGFLMEKTRAARFLK